MTTNEFSVTLDDFLWAFLWAGFLMTAAYVRSELVEHRTRRAREDQQLAQRRSLFPSGAPKPLPKAANADLYKVHRTAVAPVPPQQKSCSCTG